MFLLTGRLFPHAPSMQNKPACISGSALQIANILNYSEACVCKLQQSFPQGILSS